MDDLILTRRGSSANIDFFRANRDDIYVEVLCDYLTRENGKLTLRELPLFRITVHQHQHDQNRWSETHSFTYTPKSKPDPGNHLDDALVTELVKARLT